MSLQSLSDVLFEERRVLELLLFRLETERLVLATGSERWLALASREVDVAADELNRVELARSVCMAQAAPELDLGPDATLATLVAAVPRPWATIFAEHQKTLRSLMTEVLAAAQSSSHLLREGYDSIRMALESTA